jgi:hypothetical protein
MLDRLLEVLEHDATLITSVSNGRYHVFLSTEGGAGTGTGATLAEAFSGAYRECEASMPAIPGWS